MPFKIAESALAPIKVEAEGSKAAQVDDEDGGDADADNASVVSAATIAAR